MSGRFVAGHPSRCDLSKQVSGLTTAKNQRISRVCSLPFIPFIRYTAIMNTTNQPNVKFVQTSDYREAYANSVQIRVNVWDFFLVFGTMQQSTETQVELRNFQGVYLSPQQAKALMALLQQNVANYESAFGEIKLDPRAPGGPIH